MEKGEMYFRIIEEVYVREDNSAKYSLSHASLKQNKAYYSKGSEVHKSANVLHFNVWIVSDGLFHFFPQSLHILTVTALEAIAYSFRAETFHGFFEVAKTAPACVKASSFTIFNLRVLLLLI